MTALVPGRARLFTRAGAAPYRAVDEVGVGETATVRRCAMYRKAFRSASVSYPVDVLRVQPARQWVLRHGVAVDVATAGDVGLALYSGVLAQRLIVHADNRSEDVITAGLTAGAGRFVVQSHPQVDLLASSTPQRQRVLIDLTGCTADALVADIVAAPGLELIGVHRTLVHGECGVATVRATIAAMRRICRRYGLFVPRLSLADVDVARWDCPPLDLRGVALAIDGAVEDGCISSAFPRPAIGIAPSAAYGVTCSQR